MVEQLTLNQRVEGSSPPRLTNLFNKLRYVVPFKDFFRLRADCSRLLMGLRIERVYPSDVSSGDQVTIDIYGDLNARVPHLLFDISQGCAWSDQRATHRVSEVVESDLSEPGFLDGWKKVVMNQVRGIQYRSGLGGKTSSSAILT